MKLKLPLIILLIVCGLYCLVFAPFGNHKLYDYKVSETTHLDEGHTFSGLHGDDNGIPCKLTFVYLVSSDEVQPDEFIAENVSITGVNSGITAKLGSLSLLTESDNAICFDFQKERGMQYEPYDIEASIILVFPDGSKKYQTLKFRITTNYREVDKMPWWAGLVF